MYVQRDVHNIDQITQGNTDHTNRPTETDAIVKTGREQIEQGTKSRLVLVRNYLSRRDDVSTRPDTGDIGTGRGCGRKVDVGSVGVGGTGMA